MTIAKNSSRKKGRNIVQKKFMMLTRLSSNSECTRTSQLYRVVAPGALVSPHQ